MYFNSRFTKSMFFRGIIYSYGCKDNEIILINNIKDKNNPGTFIMQWKDVGASQIPVSVDRDGKDEACSGAV